MGEQTLHQTTKVKHSRASRFCEMFWFLVVILKVFLLNNPENVNLTQLDTMAC